MVNAAQSSAENFAASPGGSGVRKLAAQYQCMYFPIGVSSPSSGRNTVARSTPNVPPHNTASAMARRPQTGSFASNALETMNAMTPASTNTDGVDETIAASPTSASLRHSATPDRP